MCSSSNCSSVLDAPHPLLKIRYRMRTTVRLTDREGEVEGSPVDGILGTRTEPSSIHGVIAVGWFVTIKVRQSLLNIFGVVLTFFISGF
ncbi:hypothetical protein SUGI_1006390 [Cryptomeria japonica]|nr:hypothetical protein SUGI_1006390 [Cryptomeria japonica]